MALISVEISNKKFIELLNDNAETFTKTQYDQAILQLASCTELTHSPAEQAALLSKLTKILGSPPFAKLSSPLFNKKQGSEKGINVNDPSWAPNDSNL